MRKFYGAIALSNLAERNRLPVFTLSDHLPTDWTDALPLDSSIRLLDAVAPFPLFPYLERIIAATAERKGPAHTDESVGGALLGRRQVPPAFQPSQKGVAASLWFNFRQRMFTRKRKGADDLVRYGRGENYNRYGDSKGWGEASIGEQAGVCPQGRPLQHSLEPLTFNYLRCVLG